MMWNPKVMAAILLVPTFIGCATCIFVVPWLLEVRQRLDNEFWEGQIVFAATSLMALWVVFPSLILRLRFNHMYLAYTIWTVCIMTYGSLFIYVTQSLMSIDMKGIFGGSFMVLIILSFIGLCSERGYERENVAEQVAASDR